MNECHTIISKGRIALRNGRKVMLKGLKISLNIKYEDYKIDYSFDEEKWTRCFMDD